MAVEQYQKGLQTSLLSGALARAEKERGNIAGNMVANMGGNASPTRLTTWLGGTIFTVK